MRTATAYYAVDPKKLSQVLSEKREEPELNTGLLKDDILQVYRKGERSVVFSYRKPQITGIWIDGHDELLTVPMPGLILARSLADSSHNGSYHIVAVKRRPQPGSKLFVVPLPNVNTSGVCWGTVAKPLEKDMNDMSNDWIQFLGSPFNNHSVNNKSQSHQSDVRELLKELDKKKAKRYPYSDLIPITGGKNKPLTYKEWAERVCR